MTSENTSHISVERYAMPSLRLGLRDRFIPGSPSELAQRQVLSGYRLVAQATGLETSKPAPGF